MCFEGIRCVFLGLGPRLVILFVYLFYCALMYVLLYINVHTMSPLVIVTANHISAPPGFPHPAALGIRIVRLPTVYILRWGSGWWPPRSNHADYSPFAPNSITAQNKRITWVQIQYQYESKWSNKHSVHKAASTASSECYNEYYRL